MVQSSPFIGAGGRRMPTNVRCADCGFLAVIDRTTGDMERMPVGFRKQQPHPITRPWADLIPFCTMLAREWSDSARGKTDSVTNILEECPEFFEWHPGFTPQEHRQMRMEQWLLNREDRRDQVMREREDARDDAMRAREDKRDEAAKDRHDEQMKIVKGNHWRELVVLGLAIGVAMLLGSIIQAGWIAEPAWWPLATAYLAPVV